VTFYVFFEMTHQKVVKSRQTFSHQSIKMSSYSSLSDHCNSIPSSHSVIHFEQLLNVNVYRNFGLKIYFWARYLMLVTYTGTGTDFR